MYRVSICAFVLATAGLTARAGELDRESPRAVPSFPAATPRLHRTSRTRAGPRWTGSRRSPRTDGVGVSLVTVGDGGGAGAGVGFTGPTSVSDSVTQVTLATGRSAFYSPFYTGYYSAFGWPYHAYFPAYYYAPAAYGWWW